MFCKIGIVTMVQSYNLVMSFAQQKLILADVRLKKQKLWAHERKKFFETILTNSHNYLAWKMSKNKGSRKQPVDMAKTMSPNTDPMSCCWWCFPALKKREILCNVCLCVTDSKSMAGISHWLCPWHDSLPGGNLRKEGLAFSKVRRRYCFLLRLIN